MPMDWKRRDDAGTSFAQQVRARLATGERRGSLIEHSPTPAVLRMLGCPAVPLTMAPSILFKLASGKGGDRPPLSPRQIERLPEFVDDPVAIYTQPDGLSWAVLSSEWDARGNPILICVRPRCRDGVRQVNAITTAFGKDRPDDWALRQRHALRYRGAKENPRLTLPGLIYYQTGALETEGCGESVRGPGDLRKFREDSRARAAAGGRGLGGPECPC